MASRALLALALVAAAAAGAARAADDLGTLFFTPQERSQLDRLRRGEPESRVNATMARHAVTGFVRRSDERNTVWIDGAPIPLNGTTPEALLKQDVKRGADVAKGAVRVERKPAASQP